MGKNKFLLLFGSNVKKQYLNGTNFTFILVVLLASFTSLVHVTSFWTMTNSLLFAVILSICTGFSIIGTMLASKYTRWSYGAFLLIMLMELLGNIFHAFVNIDVKSDKFVGFKNLMDPVFTIIYSDPQIDLVYMRWIACIEGGFIPILVAIMFHMWMEINNDKIKNVNVFRK